MNSNKLFCKFVSLCFATGISAFTADAVASEISGSTYKYSQTIENYCKVVKKIHGFSEDVPTEWLEVSRIERPIFSSKKIVDFTLTVKNFYCFKDRVVGESKLSFGVLDPATGDIKRTNQNFTEFTVTSSNGSFITDGNEEFREYIMGDAWIRTVWEGAQEYLCKDWTGRTGISGECLPGVNIQDDFANEPNEKHRLVRHRSFLKEVDGTIHALEGAWKMKSIKKTAPTE